MWLIKAGLTEPMDDFGQIGPSGGRCGLVTGLGSPLAR